MRDAKMTFLHELNFIRYKPNCAKEAQKHVVAGLKLTESYGARIIGIWRTDAGAAYEIVVLVEWNSLEARADAHIRMTHDDEIRSNFDLVASMLNTRENFICKLMPSKVAQLRSLPKLHSGYTVLQMLKVKGNPQTAIEEFQRTVELMKTTSSNLILNLEAVMLPVIYPKFRLLVLWRPNETSRSPQELEFDFLNELSNLTQLESFHQHLHESSVRVLVPLHSPANGRRFTVSAVRTRTTSESLKE